MPSKYPRLDHRPNVTDSRDQPMTMEAVRTGITDERTPDSRQERYYVRAGFEGMSEIKDRNLGRTLGSIPCIHGTRRTYRNRTTMISPSANEVIAAVLDINGKISTS